MNNTKITDTKVFKSTENVVRWAHWFEDKCEVHYSTKDKIQDAVVTYASNPTCGERTHKKLKVQR